jgi:hypothetical protein
MGDAGEALIDAESRIQERMEDLARARKERRDEVTTSPETIQAIESLRLARLDLERQRGRRHEAAARSSSRPSAIDRRITALSAS